MIGVGLCMYSRLNLTYIAERLAFDLDKKNMKDISSSSIDFYESVVSSS